MSAQWSLLRVKRTYDGGPGPARIYPDVRWSLDNNHVILVKLNRDDSRHLFAQAGVIARPV